ncbi:MAG: ATP-binding protein [archaeon]
MAEEKPIARESKLLRLTNSLTFKTLMPILVIILLVVSIFGIYISGKTKNSSKEFLIQNVLMPEFEQLAKEKNNDFDRIKSLTEFTAKEIENRINISKNRSDEETEKLFGKYVSIKPDGSYRSERDESRGRFQMAAFHNNLMVIDSREKGIFADAFLYFDPFGQSQMPFVYTTYFATKNSIWQYGFPDWALTSAANETFDQYGWFYGADPEHDPSRQQVWTDMYYDDFQKQWMISSLMPIYDGVEFLGIVGQDFILQKIIEITKQSKVGETGMLFFIDNLGNIVAHPDTESLIGKKGANDEILSLKTIPDEALSKALQNLSDESGFKYTEEKDRRIVMYFPLESVHWKMIYIVNEEEFLKIATQTNKQYLTSFALFSLFVIVLIVLIINYMVARPIKRLTEATEEISKGNLDKKIGISSNDEIGVLAYTFNQMTQDIKKSRDELENYGKNLEKKVEERTKELESKNEELEKFDKIFQNTLDGIVVADAETGIILDCNPAACELVGRKKSELIGKHQSILHPKKVKGEDSNTFQDHLHEKEGKVLETKVITKDGKIKDVAIKANVFEFGGKKLIHGVFRDITDKKDYEDRIVRINKRLEEANQKLKNLDQQKDEFISLSAHELKTPLTSIRGFAQLMNNDAILKNKEKSKHFLSLIDENTQRLYNLIVDLVDSSRISLGKLKLNIEDVDVYKLYNDIKENMSPAIKEKGLTGEFFIEKGLPKIKADSERIMQVIRNLITNSIKFTGKGTISLKVYKKGKLVQFEVKDTGQGIPKENKKFLFSKFYQVDSSMTRKVGGSGLGLSICKGLVESMGGKIWFTSEEGKGSTFYFTMPIAK